MVLQPNRQLRCSYTPLFSMRVGLGATDVESRVFLVSPHSSPLQRGRVRWLVTRQFLCAIRVLTCQEFSTHLGVQILSLGNARLLEATFPLQQVFFRSVHFQTNQLCPSDFFILGRGKGKTWRKVIRGFAYCSYWSFTSLSSTIKGREKLKRIKIFKSQYYKVTFG